MTSEETQDKARRALARIETALSELPPDELAALREVAEAAEDVDVEGFDYSMSATFATMSGGGAGGDDMLFVLMAYQKLAAKEVRANRTIAGMSPSTRARKYP